MWTKILLGLLIPVFCAASQTSPYERVRLAPQLVFDLESLAAGTPLQLGKPIPRPTPAQQHAYQKKTQWKWTAAGMLTLGTATLLTGVRLFNQGKNAKKIAAGDALIPIGLSIDIAAVAPIVMAIYWHRKL